LYLNLDADHASEDAQAILGSDQDDLLERLTHALKVPDVPGRTRRDLAQTLSMLRALLELSGAQTDHLQHDFSGDYTTRENQDLVASMFGIRKTNNFGDFDAEQMQEIISKSAVFSGTTISVCDLESWTASMMRCLSLGFPRNHLVGCLVLHRSKQLTELESP